MTTPVSSAVSKQVELFVSQPQNAVGKQVELVVSKPVQAVSKQVEYIVLGSSISPTPGSAPGVPSRLRQTIAAHFAQQATYPGRQARAFAPAARTQPVYPTVGPGRSPRQHLLTIARHFKTAGYEGRGQRFTYGGGTNLANVASQVVAETLTRTQSGGRATMAMLEPLLKTRAPVRASGFNSEVLYAQQNPAYVRASELVIEALVPFLETPALAVYPELVGLTFKVSKRPKFSTGAGVFASGREVRVGYWSKPQWEWDLTYDILNDNNKYVGSTVSDIKTLLGFFLSVYGSQFPFLFRDPDDCTQVGQPLGVGDGTTKTFYFSRTYGLGTFVGTENVGGVNLEEPLTIYHNGVAQTDNFILNTATPCGNYVQFPSPPEAGVVISADFSFYYFCRMKDDTAEFEKFMQDLWDTQKLTIFSLRN